MDIRKFFGPQSLAKKGSEANSSRSKDGGLKSAKTAPTKNEPGKSLQKKTGAASPQKEKTGAASPQKKKTGAASPQKKKTGAASPQKKKTGAASPQRKKTGAASPQKKKTSGSSPRKKLVLESENVLIVEDVSDEEVIKNSQQSKGRKCAKDSQGKSESKNVNGEVAAHAETSGNVLHKLTKSRREKSKAKSEFESDIEIESVKSSGSSVTQLSSSQKKKELKRSGARNENGDKRSENRNEENGEGDTELRKSPRKKNSQESTKERKRRKCRQISSDDDDEVSIIKIDDGDEDEDEEAVTSRKHRSRASVKQAKRSSRVLESDTEEDPLSKDKPKAKRKKKEPITFVDESDVEKKETVLDKFVIHNAKSTPETTDKRKNSDDSSCKGKPVSVLDFFGTGTASRSDRTTAVAKRQHPEIIKAEEIDLTFDDEAHDDDDFMKTLDQLDGPSIKKAKLSEINEDEAKDTKEKGSLANKLAGKMKSSAHNKTEPPEQAPKESTPSLTKITAAAAHPVKGRSSPRKGRVYTMEVTKTKPAAEVESPVKSKQQEETTPQKKGPLTSKGKGPSERKKKAEGTNEDDGFGPKTVGAFRAYKTRSGPQALGSQDIPEGAENCLEGLTFVITGILEAIERDDAKALIERHGGKVTGSVSRKTSYMVVGREAGESKLKKAQDLKVQQIDQDELFDLIRSLPGKISKYEVQAKEKLEKEASLKKLMQEKEAATAKKLASFRSEKDVRNSKETVESPSKKKSLFTQIKDPAESNHASIVPSPSSQNKDQSPTQKQYPTANNPVESLLWVDKHKPTNIKQIIGQQGEKSNAKKLLHWLESWHENVLVKGLKPSGNFFGRGDGAGCRAALLSGPPGIGKTTTATLVCQELKFSYVELNASDTRSKRSLKEVVSESLSNQTLVDYMGDHSGAPTGQSHCLIMDEVDGMAGNEDRGGLQELVQLIKATKIPIICICNDRNSMKMRTLSNYCLDLRFQRPRAEQIKGAMMSIAFREGVKIPPAALSEIIGASNHDIRQIIHNMSMWSAGNKTLTFDQVKKDAQKAHKDIKLGPFDVCRKVFINDDETRKMSISDKSDLFFYDYSFGPLFVHENYPHIIPASANGDHARHLSCLARTIDSICDGDLIDKMIRKEGSWNLLPVQAMYSSVIPGEIMRGSFPQMAEFPQWLGKFSTTNKTHRILQELGTHMRLEISCDKRGLNLDYLPALRSRLTAPLTSLGSDGVPDVIKVMDDYDIIREDFDNIMEVTKWPNSHDPISKLDPKVKAAFTRQYNKEIHITPYATGAVSKKRRGRAAAADESDLLFEEQEGGEEGVAPEAESGAEDDEEDVEADTMIKTKKQSKGKGGSQTSGSGRSKGRSQQSGSGKGKGKGGGGGGGGSKVKR